MPITPLLLFGQDELSLLLSHSYSLRQVKFAFESERGGWGEAIALSRLMHCEAFIAFHTAVSCIMQTKLEAAEKKTQIEALFTKLKALHPLPELLEDTLKTPLPVDDALALSRHYQSFKRYPTAKQIFTNNLTLGFTPQLCERLMLHMNQMLTYVISTQFKIPGEHIFLLLDTLNAQVSRNGYTSPFMFSSRDIKATFKGNDPSELLNWLQVHLQTTNKAEMEIIVEPNPQHHRMVSTALGIGFFAVAAYGLKRALDLRRSCPVFSDKI